MKELIGWKPAGDINIASSRLRAFIPCKKLAELHWPTELYSEANKENYKIVIFQKAYTKEDIALAIELKSKGVIIVFDQCDNHFFNPLNDIILTERAERLKEMVDVADYITVSTKSIAALFQGKRTYVVDDFIELPVIPSLLKLWYKIKFLFLFEKSLSIKLVWFGNAGSVNPRFGMIDLTALLEPLENVNKIHPIELTIISNSQALFSKYVEGKTSFRIKYIPWDKKTFEYIVAQHDLCIIPIHSNPFTVCKTNNRVVLSLLLGVPVVADPIPSYEEFAPYIALSNWENNILGIVKNKKNYQAKVKAGQKFIKEHYGEQKIIEQWQYILKDILVSSK